MAERRKILVVDDEVKQCENMSELLTLRDYDVSIATGGKQALALIKEAFFPVILLDLKMPDLDGEVVLEEAVKLHPTSKVIMVTGHSEGDSKDSFLKMGAYDYIVKPIDFDSLFTMLDTLYKEIGG